MERQFDVVVVGGGSAGEVAAGRLAEAGSTVALVESDLIGGECSYWACMPAKALLRPGQIVAEADRVPGVRRALTAGVDIDDVLHRRDELASFWEDSAQESWLDEHNVELVRGRGHLVGRRRVAVNEDVLVAKEVVIIATGSRAAVPPIDGIEDVKLWDNRDITSAQGVPRRMLIVGGGAVGVESAQAWRRLGTEEVTLVESAERLLPSEEPFASAELEDALQQDGIRVITNAEISSFSQQDLTTSIANVSDGSEITADVVVAATGRQPATDDLGLDVIGLVPGEPIETDESMRSVDHPDWLYAIGDVTGRDLFTHMGKYEARIAANAILERDGDRVTTGRRAVPRVVFTDPIVAAVGHTEATAKSAGIDAETRIASIAEQAEASIWGKDVKGTAKLALDPRNSTVIGATFTGPAPLAELVSSAQIAIITGAPLELLAHVVPQFPSFSEVWLDLLDA